VRWCVGSCLAPFDSRSRIHIVFLVVPRRLNWTVRNASGCIKGETPWSDGFRRHV
jgi:hypothetical protein